MTEVIEKHQLHSLKPPALNFDIRAAIAVRDQKALQNFYKKFKDTNAVTYTVWSVESDEVDAKELESFVKSIGVKNVYLIVSDELRKKLDLNNGASSLVQFGILNVAALAIATIFRNGLH